MTVVSLFSPANKIIPARCKIAIGLFVLLVGFSSQATLFFTDQFNYTDGADLGSTTGGGGATWTLASGDVTQIKVTTGSTQISPSGYASASGRGVVVTTTSSTRKTTGVPFNGTTGIPATDGNVVYASFLLNVQALPSSGNIRVAYLNNVAASASAALEVWWSAARDRWAFKRRAAERPLSAELRLPVLALIWWSCATLFKVETMKWQFGWTLPAAATD